ncbi:MAG: DUF4845 domain-containing protein [Betaproteobacteria bacterium]
MTALRTVPVRLAPDQRGLIGLAGLGWVLWAVCLLALVLKVTPGIGEHSRVLTLVRGIAAASPANAQDVQQAFDARTVVNRVESLTGRDLVVTRENGVLVISYAYDHKIVILDRVILLIRYQGSTREALR